MAVKQFSKKSRELCIMLKNKVKQSHDSLQFKVVEKAHAKPSCGCLFLIHSIKTCEARSTCLIILNFMLGKH